MIRPIIITLTLFSMFLATGEAAARNLYICDKPTVPAVYPGSKDTGIARFVGRNFKYPLEAWREQQVFSLGIKAIIHTDGHVGDFEFTARNFEPHPLLLAEIRRVLDKMEWYPAYDENGKPVNSYQKFYLPLRKESHKYNFYIPLGLEDKFAGTVECERMMCSCAGLPPAADEAIATIEEGKDLFFTHPLTMMSYARLLNGKGKNAEAVEVIDNFLQKYQEYEYTLGVDELGDTVQVTSSNTYDGREEMLLGIVRAVIHDDSIAYADANKLIHQRMLDNRLYPMWRGRRRDASDQRIAQMKREMVNEFTRGGLKIDRNTTTTEDVWGHYSVDDLSSSLAYWDERGQVNNAAVSQLVERIKQERLDAMHGKHATKTDQLNLYGVKAMLTLLMEGDGAMRKYIAGIKDSGSSKKLHSYLEKLEKRYEANATLLTDREGALQAIACLLPPDGTDPTTFYARRKALEEVFPLQWLMGK